MGQQIYLPFGGQYLIPCRRPLERCFDGDGNFKKGKRSNA